MPKTVLKPAEKTFLIRSMPADLLRRLRSRAALEDRSVRAVVVDALEDYLKSEQARRDQGPRMITTHSSAEGPLSVDSVEGESLGEPSPL